MAGGRGTTTAALEQLRAEFDRMAARCRALQAEAAVQVEARRQLVRERDALLAELARRQATSPADSGELALLREKQHASERARETAGEALALLRRQHAAVQGELAAARDELLVAEEERACLEEQIRSLARSLTLLTAENRLLRQERRGPSSTGSPGMTP